MRDHDGHTINLPGPVTVGEPAPRSARQEAVEALRTGYREARDCEWFGEDEVLAHALDSIPPELLARLAIENGGLEQVGWGGCPKDDPVCDEDGHEWGLVHEDGTWLLDRDHPVWPVYALVVPSPGAAADPQHQEARP